MYQYIYILFINFIYIYIYIYVYMSAPACKVLYYTAMHKRVPAVQHSMRMCNLEPKYYKK